LDTTMIGVGDTLIVYDCTFPRSYQSTPSAISEIST
jgi:hypothetical protein